MEGIEVNEFELGSWTSYRRRFKSRITDPKFKIHEDLNRWFMIWIGSICSTSETSPINVCINRTKLIEELAELKSEKLSSSQEMEVNIYLDEIKVS